MKANGFTLVELVMAVALVSVLSIPALSHFSTTKTELVAASALQERYQWIDLLNRANQGPK